MTNFNAKMTIEEATAIFNFKGQSFWADTAHNRALMAGLAHDHLQSLQGKK